MNSRPSLLRLLLASALACAAGCCTCLPRIDPTGERVLIWPKDQPQAAALTAPSSAIVAPPVTTDPFFPAPAVAATPGTIVAPGVTPASVALAQVPQDKVGITPERILAPVNSEVVLKASVCTTEGFTLTDQKVEWMLGRNGVGQFVEVSGKGWMHPPLLPWNKPKKVDNYLATGWTASGPLCVTRGTADPADDVEINAGDAWISVTSPNEGTSYVTAFMPTVESWEQRRSSATIYWVDVQWTFPPPGVPSDGRSAPLTTTVTRQTNGTPIEGWLVRYELTDGGGNLSGGAGGQVVEVRTDANGQATVVATPTAAGAATTPVNVQLIRPAGFGGGDAPRLVVGTGTSLIQWGGGSYLAPSGATPTPTMPVPTLPDTVPATPPGGWTPPSTGPTIPPIPAQRPQLEISLTGDATSAVGGIARVTMAIVNTGTGPATNVRVVDQFDAGLMQPQYPDSQVIEFEGIGTMAAGQRVEREIEFHVLRAGRLCHNVRVTSGENAADSAQFCTTATQPPEERAGRVEVRKEAGAGAGPVVATVGEMVRFRITVKNTGDLALVDIRVRDEYPPAFFDVRPPANLNAVSGVINYTIPRLERGQQHVLEVDAVARQAAMPLISRPLVHVTALTDPATRPIAHTAEVNMEIRPPNPAGGAGNPAAGGAGPATGARAPISVLTSFYQRPARIGSRTTCEIVVTNVSTAPDEQIELRVVLPPQLTPDLTAIQLPPNVQVFQEGSQLRFTPVVQLRPTERVKFLIPMTVAGPAGVPEVETVIRSRNAPNLSANRVTLEIGNLQ